MHYGILSARQSQFPNEKPPTLFHPASPKMKPVKPSKEVKDLDAASIKSTSTFASTVSLLKGKLSSSHKKSSSSNSAQRPSTMSFADYVNGEHKTRKRQDLKDFILMKE